MSSSRRAQFIRVRGVVQGVGFRPFVYGLATGLGLGGWVRNTSAGVEIALEGPAEALATFGHDLAAEAPPRARIEGIVVEEAPLNGYQRFEIRTSQAQGGEYQLVSPDIGVCEDCRRELFDPHDRRYRYPFTNCTNCGPRFTIIRDIPYDRPSTTMAAFAMCPACQAEYDDPRNRRFHAQPNACPVCGPHVMLATPSGQVLAEREEAIQAARRALAEGRIVAVKGLGGFQLACDATSEAAVARLRQRKRRPHKPLAVMVWDLAAARHLGEVSAAEASLLESPERPIVLLEALDAPSPPRWERGAMAPQASPSPSKGEGGGEGDALTVAPSCDSVMPSSYGAATPPVEVPPLTLPSPPGGEGTVAKAHNDPSPSKGEGGGEGDAPTTAPGCDSEMASSHKAAALPVEVPPLTLPSPPGGEGTLARAHDRPSLSRGAGLAPGVAPGTGTVGVMLPYTPLHYLLLEPEPGYPPALVMTSGNLSEEPIAMENDEALARLGGIADLFLLHDRGIYARYDDSVWFVSRERPQPVRRARGYAPFPIKLPNRGPQVLACGPELKNTFCYTRDEYAFLSPHIGDLENLETLQHYERSLDLYRHLFRLDPHIVAYDLHPEYLATKLAKERWGEDEGVTLVPVQHHHAHIAACLVDNGRKGPAIGVALDGTGYGTDGLIWGGEFLVADLHGFRRAGRLAEFPLPGGAAAIRRPYRTALGLVLAAGMEPEAWPALRALPADEVAAVRLQVSRGLNAPLTTSAGRLFDAVAALAGVRGEISYEAQAAMELEALAAQATGVASPYPFDLLEDGAGWVLDWRPLLAALLADLEGGLGPVTAGARFHAGMARAVVAAVRRIAEASGLNVVALSGGCFQNRLLLAQTARGLEDEGLEVLVHRQVPANDGGVSLGQAAIAAAGPQNGRDEKG